MNREDIERKIIRTDSGCWIWPGAHLLSGYGSVRFGGRGHVVHRLTYEWANGSIPHGMQIDHLCRNRGCCNPAHLEAVTQRTNLLRGVGFSAKNAAKTQCPRGHSYTPENTYVHPDGGRHCRICRTALKARWEAKRRTKRRGQGDPGQQYVTMTLDVFAALLEGGPQL